MKRKHLVIFGIGLFLLLAAASSVPASPAIQGPPSFSALAQEVKHTVVNVFTTQTVKADQAHPFLGPDNPFRDFFGDEFHKRFFGDMPREYKTNALGSGFVLDAEGHIMTNNHVVEKADEIKIKMEGGKEYDARVVGRDPKTDLALIKVEPDADFPKPAILGDSDAIRIGDWVMAVGNPFGLNHTVTVGIIGAKGRIIGAGPYDDFLQTDAAINPGNSGGPLFNMKGEVIGINTAIVAQGQGIGFAIPVKTAKDLLSQLKAGKVIRGWLGVLIQDVTPELANSFGLKEAKGVLIADVVEDGPADKSGLKRGDVIVGFKGKEVENAHMLSSSVAITPPDTKVEVQIIRDGQTKTIEATLGTMPEEGEPGKPVKTETEWGLSVQSLTPELAQRFGWSADEQGVIVSDIKPGTPAADSGIRRGDLIQEANRRKVKNVEDFREAMKKTGKGENLLLLVKRGENTIWVVIKAPAK